MTDTAAPFRPIYVDELSPRPSHEFRHDIQGLRAVAVVLTLIWHARFSFLPHGYVGVDAFFVISGFLITGLIIEERASTGRVNLREFYARRARRLLPASGLVIVVTVVLCVLLVPEIRWAQIRSDALASAFYVENWRLAGQSLDYVAQDAAPSPLQHYWSLAVEEQFYLVWPLVIMLFTPRGSLSRGVMTRLLALGIGAVLAGSFVWSVVYSSRSPGPAYFVTTTRAWEFALGAMTALFLNRPRHDSARPSQAFDRRLAAALSWLGLAVLIGSALWMPAGTAFPGYVALAPTLGTAFVLLFGPAAGTAGPQALLGRRPLVFVGALSYSLYLWHWPLLVVAEARWGALELWQSAAIVSASAIPAYLAYRWVETPVRRWTSRSTRAAGSRHGLLIGAGCTAIAAAAALGLGALAPSSRAVSTEAEAALAQIESSLVVDPSATTTTAADAPPAGSAGDEPTENDVTTTVLDEAAPSPGIGALSIDEPSEQAAFTQPDSFDEIVPDPLNAGGDVPDGFCRQGIESSEVLDCLLGDADGEFEIALVGDSHASQWISTLDAITRARGWRLRVYAKAACNYTALKLPQAGQDQGSEEYVSCTEWNSNVHRTLLETRPAVVLITGREPRIWTSTGLRNLEESRSDAIEDKVARWGELVDNGSRVVALASTPVPHLDVPECVSEHRSSLTSCTFDRGDAVDLTGGSAQAAADRLGIAVVDVNDAICPAERCPVVVGGVLVYRDPTHLTDTYARTMTPLLSAALDRVSTFDTGS